MPSPRLCCAIVDHPNRLHSSSASCVLAVGLPFSEEKVYSGVWAALRFSLTCISGLAVAPGASLLAAQLRKGVLSWVHKVLLAVISCDTRLRCCNQTVIVYVRQASGQESSLECNQV